MEPSARNMGPKTVTLFIFCAFLQYVRGFVDQQLCPKKLVLMSNIPNKAVQIASQMENRILVLSVGESTEYVKTCMIKQPRDIFVNCSTHAVQILFNEIPKGVPAIGLDRLDPLYVPSINILQGGGGPVTVNASLSNVTVLGFGNTKIVHNSVDPKTYDFYTKLHLPRLRIDGNYELFGRILVIPLKGKGSCWFDAKNLDINVKSDVIMEKHDGFNFFNVTDVHVKFSIGGLKLHMYNLFDGIKALEDSTNAYLNANWRPVAESLSPILSKTIEDIMVDILRKVFDNIPANFFLGDLDP